MKSPTIGKHEEVQVLCGPLLTSVAPTNFFQIKNYLIPHEEQVGIIKFYIKSAKRLKLTKNQLFC